MISLALILALWPQANPTSQPPPPPDAPPASTQPAVRYDEGPLRAEIVAMREIRFFAADPEMAARMQPELGLQLRICGERIDQVARQGNLIVDELVDDTGKVLFDPATYTELDRTVTRPARFTPEQVRNTGLLFTVTRAKPAERQARNIKVLRGSVRLIFATVTEKVTVDNPAELVGKTVAHPRLEALGVEIAVVPSDQLENAPPADRALALHYLRKGENVQSIAFYDGWMKQVPARDSWVTTKEGQQVQLYYFDGPPLNNETQMVIDVHPTVDDVKFPVELRDIPLP